MPYLICENCGGYYELQKGESADDFEKCQCGGKLRYYETMQDYTNFSKYHPKSNIQKNQFEYELDLYNNIKKDEKEYKQHQYELNRYKFFSENFITNSGFIVLTFAIIPLFYSFVYSNWILYLITGISVILSLVYFFNTNMNDEIRENYFQKIFIFTGIIFGLTALCLLSFLLNKEFIYDLLIPTYYSRGGNVIAYISSLIYSFSFSYIFIKNSLMEERIDYLNLSDKEDLYLNYYPFIFAFFLIMITGMVLTIL